MLNFFKKYLKWKKNTFKLASKYSPCCEHTYPNIVYFLKQFWRSSFMTVFSCIVLAVLVSWMGAKMFTVHGHFGFGERARPLTVTDLINKVDENTVIFFFFFTTLPFCWTALSSSIHSIPFWNHTDKCKRGLQNCSRKWQKRWDKRVQREGEFWGFFFVCFFVLGALVTMYLLL